MPWLLRARRHDIQKLATSESIRAHIASVRGYSHGVVHSRVVEWRAGWRLNGRCWLDLGFNALRGVSLPRYRNKPDTRYRWNDPDLPVWFLGRWWTAEEYQKACQHEIEFNKCYIHYTKDKSYDWKKEAKERKEKKQEQVTNNKTI